MTEKEFLKSYNSDRYEKPSVTVDMAVFTIDESHIDNYRKLSEKKLKILLIKRGQHPFKDQWALPGGFVGIDESIDDAAHRELKEETNIEGAYLEQLYTWGEVGRDPRTRVISTSYLSLYNPKGKNLRADSDASEALWFSIDYKLMKETKELVKGGYRRKKTYTLTLSNTIHTFDIVIKQVHSVIDQVIQKDLIIEENCIAFDHCNIIIYALERLRTKVEYSDMAFRLMPELFSLTQLQQVYEIILNKPLLKANFRRKITSKVIRSNEVTKNAGHRPSTLYRFNYDWENEV